MNHGFWCRSAQAYRFLEERAGVEISGSCFCGELGFRATDQNENDRVWFIDGHLSSGFVLLIEKFTQSRGWPTNSADVAGRRRMRIPFGFSIRERTFVRLFFS